MHKNAFTPENAAMLLIDHRSARSLGRIRFNCDELRNIRTGPPPLEDDRRSMRSGGQSGMSFVVELAEHVSLRN